MKRISCEVAVIGAGTAGITARTASSELGAHAVLIDEGPGGTTCARIGCMPSKLLIAAANANEATRHLGVFGLRLGGPVGVDGRAVMARVQRERDRLVGSVRASVDRIAAEDRIAGRARFVGPTALAVDGSLRVEARAIVIATGAKPAIPKALAGLGDLILTNETVFELPDLPGSLAVVGAGPVGIELGQAFARLGVRVAIFDEGDKVGGLTDPEVLAEATRILGAELELHLGATLSGEPGPEGARIAWTGRDGAAGSARFERVLIAAGRPPALHGLGLDAAGIVLDDRGRPEVDPETLLCRGGPVFLAGDAFGDRPVLHEASIEGRLAGRNAARYPKVERAERDAMLAITFTDPQIAVIGGGWTRFRDRKPAIGEADFGKSGRGRVMDKAAGRLRLYGEPEGGRILGAELCAPEAEHLAHLIAWAVQRRLTAAEMLALPYYHPTLEETLKSAVRDLCGKVRSDPELSEGDIEAGVNA